MLTQKDIGKQYKVGGHMATLRAFQTDHKGKQQAFMFDDSIKNPSNIPGLSFFWIDATELEG